MPGILDNRLDRAIFSDYRRTKQDRELGGHVVEPVVRVGGLVRVDGHKETFLVLRIDHERHLADLLRQGTVRKVEAGIPLTLLRPVREPDAAGDVEASA